MNSPRFFRVLAAATFVLGSLALTGCPDYEFSKNTMGQDAVQRHYDAGEMSEAQYEQAMRRFDPSWQPKPPESVSGNVTPSGTAKPPAGP